MEPDLTDPTLPNTDVAEEMDFNTAGNYLADASAWNLWPIMLEGRAQRMTVSVTANGVDIPVPGPDDDVTLAFFVDAYRKAAAGGGEVLSCLKPKKELGAFASEYTYAATVVSPAARDLGLEGAPHHICLLRGPELVTRYYAGPERPNPHVGYAGVFKVADDLDPVFARSEPPTHDAWAYQELTGPEATFVRTLGRRLKERCDTISGATGKRAFKVGDYAVGNVAQRLGHLLAGPGGTGTAIIDVSPGQGPPSPPDRRQRLTRTHRRRTKQGLPARPGTHRVRRKRTPPAPTSRKQSQASRDAPPQPGGRPFFRHLATKSSPAARCSCNRSGSMGQDATRDTPASSSPMGAPRTSVRPGPTRRRSTAGGPQTDPSSWAMSSTTPAIRPTSSSLSTPSRTSSSRSM